MTTTLNVLIAVLVAYGVLDAYAALMLRRRQRA